ncbi:PAS domain-containing protein [Roseomonas frigidaquae]|uniref:histidine kinase n=1 Tax=Falsiroseomonas frigidaquae TaxID=487318 RepID=A0ABX1ESI8_9PROT|nr:PAS domain-containing sensor histidine kinase [Falsiroseomonas frigidaquae]NKE43498.1 PAS domain-containing protein [Falsiroseomonas frigidaquae]
MLDETCLAEGGEAGRHLRAIDWASNPLGPVRNWPLSLQTAVRIVLSSAFPMMVHWGPELITFYNDAYAPSLGRKHPGNLGRPAREWWSEMWDQLVPIFDQVLSGRSFSVENARYTPDRDGAPREAYFTHCHSPLWDDHGRIAGIFLVVTETTRQVIAERDLLQANASLAEQNTTLRESEARLRAVVSASSEVLYSMTADWKEMRQLTGGSFLADSISTNPEWLAQYIPADEQPRVRAAIEAAIRTKGLFQLEHRVYRADGSVGWTVSRAVPLLDEQGDIIEWFGTASDVTARRDAEAALQRLNETLEEQVAARTRELMTAEEALRQSQKMEAVGQLTGGVAHDFNNMLTIIRSSVDFLRRPGLPEDRRARYLEAVSDTVERASRITGQLLAFARRQTLTPEVFDVGTTLQGTVDMLRTVTGSRIHVELELPEQPCFVRADLSQFETALVNLVVNARDAMNGEGRVILRLHCGASLPPIRGHAGSSRRFAAVSVIDTGAGIPPQVIDHIFEPFFTTKDVGKGTGLGLSQVIGFTKQSGGDVEVQSEVGKGSTFTLYLPKVNPAQLAERQDASSIAPTGFGESVLVVEDNLEVGGFCTQILEDLGYKAIWVTSAEEALERLGQDGDGFQAVFSDVVMPGLGGVELARLLRSQLPDLPVVLTSGYSHVLVQENDHGFPLVHKPYSAEEVGRVLRRVLGEPSGR